MRGDRALGRLARGVRERLVVLRRHLLSLIALFLRHGRPRLAGALVRRNLVFERLPRRLSQRRRQLIDPLVVLLLRFQAARLHPLDRLRELILRSAPGFPQLGLSFRHGRRDTRVAFSAQVGELLAVLLLQRELGLARRPLRLEAAPFALDQRLGHLPLRLLRHLLRGLDRLGKLVLGAGNARVALLLRGAQLVQVLVLEPRHVRRRRFAQLVHLRVRRRFGLLGPGLALSLQLDQLGLVGFRDPHSLRGGQLGLLLARGLRRLQLLAHLLQALLQPRHRVPGHAQLLVHRGMLLVRVLLHGFAPLARLLGSAALLVDGRGHLGFALPRRAQVLLLLLVLRAQQLHPRVHHAELLVLLRLLRDDAPHVRHLLLQDRDGCRLHLRALLLRRQWRRAAAARRRRRRRRRLALQRLELGGGARDRGARLLLVMLLLAGAGGGHLAHLLLQPLAQLALLYLRHPRQDAHRVLVDRRHRVPVPAAALRRGHWRIAVAVREPRLSRAADQPAGQRRCRCRRRARGRRDIGSRCLSSAQ